MARTTALSLEAFSFQDWMMVLLDFQAPGLRAYIGASGSLASAALALATQVLGSFPDLPHLVSNAFRSWVDCLAARADVLMFVFTVLVAKRWPLGLPPMASDSRGASSPGCTEQQGSAGCLLRQSEIPQWLSVAYPGCSHMTWFVLSLSIAPPSAAFCKRFAKSNLLFILMPAECFCPYLPKMLSNCP